MDAEFYRRKAEECLREAEAATDTKDKAAWLDRQRLGLI